MNLLTMSDYFLFWTSHDTHHTRFERITFRSGVERATVAPAVHCYIAFESMLDGSLRKRDFSITYIALKFVPDFVPSNLRPRTFI